MRELLFIITLLSLMACATDQKKEVEKVTEDITGVTAVKTGQEMKTRIDSITQIQNQRAEELDELLK